MLPDVPALGEAGVVAGFMLCAPPVAVRDEVGAAVAAPEPPVIDVVLSLVAGGVPSLDFAAVDSLGLLLEQAATATPKHDASAQAVTVRVQW